MPLGVVSVEVDGAGPHRMMMPGVYLMTWWCLAPVLVCPGALFRVMQFQALSPRVSRAQGQLDCSCRVSLALGSRLSTGDRWRMM
jgi:hypothetical protein